MCWGLFPTAWVRVYLMREKSGKILYQSPKKVWWKFCGMVKKVYLCIVNINPSLYFLR